MTLRALPLGIATFAILALELAVIRWMAQQVRIFAYLSNFLLMASFLGMGWAWRSAAGIRSSFTPRFPRS